MNITVCGAGNAGHALIALLSADDGQVVSVYAPWADEAGRLRAALGEQGKVEACFAEGYCIAGRPALVTAEPATAVAEADLVLLALPSDPSIGERPEGYYSEYVR